jgi:hypothetical protein
MELCMNGALREDYIVFRRSDRSEVGTVFATSENSAITGYLQGKEPLYERDKYYARPKECREARAHFVREARKLQAELKARGIRRVIRECDILPEAPPPEPNVHELAFAVVNRPPRQLEMDLSGEEEVDF